MEKKKFDKIRQTYESSQELLKQAQKTKSKNLQQIQEEFEIAKQNYERSSYMTLNILVDVNKKNDYLSLERVSYYFIVMIYYFYYFSVVIFSMLIMNFFKKVIIGYQE